MRNNGNGIWRPALAGLALAAAATGGPAAAFEMPPDSLVRAGGRFDYRMETAAVNSPFPWNLATRGEGDRSRLMLDLAAGYRHYGQLYLKGEAWWNRPREGRGPRFRFAQGDYFWRLAGQRREFSVRVFANERRYFTGELSAPLLVDGAVTATGELSAPLLVDGAVAATGEFAGERLAVADPDDQFGIRHDGAAGDARWTALGAVVGERWEEADKFYFARAGWFGSLVQASAAYYHGAPSPDTLAHHAVVKGELSAGYRHFAAVVAYEQSGFADGAFFIPDGGDHAGPGPYPDSDRLSGLDAGAVFAELRVRRLPVAQTGLWSVVLRQRAVGDGYVDPMGLERGGLDSRLAGLYYAAAKKAIDARLEYRYRQRSRFDDKRSEGVAGMVRAQLVNGAEAYLRGGYGDATDELGVTREAGFAHAAYRRHGRSVTTGLHAMVSDSEGEPAEGRFGVEARLNFTASVSFYGRAITGQRVGGRDAVFVRLDMRPINWVFAAVGYGRFYVGDEPYLLEDPDIGRRGEAESVWFFRLRGDF